MTLRELERWIAWEIAGNYHQRVHSALNRPPIAVWREHEDKADLRLPVDRLQFWVSFLPEDERNLRRDGIHFCNIRYWSDALSRRCWAEQGELLIKYDPRDLSRIFVRRPSGSFVEARYRDLGWPAITLAEQRAVMRLCAPRDGERSTRPSCSRPRCGSGRSWTRRADRPWRHAGVANCGRHTRRRRAREVV